MSFIVMSYIDETFRESFSLRQGQRQFPITVFIYTVKMEGFCLNANIKNILVSMDCNHTVTKFNFLLLSPITDLIFHLITDLIFPLINYTT